MGNALGFVSHVQCPFQIRLSCLFLLVCLNLQAFENVKTFFSSWKWKGKSLSCVWFSVTPWTMQSVEFSRSEYWSGQPFPSPGDLPNPGTEPRSPLQEDSLPAGSQGKPKNTGVGSLSLLQGVFPSQELNPGLHCRKILYQLGHKGSPRILEWVVFPFSNGSSWPRNQTGVSCIADRFFTNWAR